MLDTLRVDLIVGHPEIRHYEGHTMVDASLAWAAGRRQLVRSIASVIHRDVAAIEGVEPTDAHGEGILLESLRLVRNEGLPAVIDDMTSITFDPRHPLLASASPRPDTICEAAIRTLAALDVGLTRVRAMPAATDEDWQQLFRLFVGAQSWTPTGWYMARVIETELGRERLQEAGATVPGFVTAYQDAALLAGQRTVADRGSMDWFLTQAPAFSDENAAWLQEELRRRFP
jgi:hypothetical protein